MIKRAGSVCARAAESVTRDIPVVVTAVTRSQETGRGGGVRSRVRCDDGDGEGACGSMKGLSDVVVVPGTIDDDLDSGLMCGEVKDVSVSVSGRQQSDTLRRGVSGGAE